MNRRWVVDDVRALFDGAEMEARDEAAATVALPADLAGPGGDPSDRPWYDDLASIHRPDRGLMVTRWREAIASPGHPVGFDVRWFVDDAWEIRRLVYLNLLEDPAFGCVVIGAWVVGSIEAPDPDEQEPEFRAPAWLMHHLDDTGHVIQMDGMVEEVLGRTPAEVVGMPGIDFLHPDDHAAAITMWTELIGRPGSSLTITQRVVSPDGLVRWMDSTMVNRLEESGVILVVAQDITAQRQQNAALRAREAELRFLAEEMPTALFHCDATGEITFANARWTQAFPDAKNLDDLDAVLDDESAIALSRAWHQMLVRRETIRVRVRRRDLATHLEFRLKGVDDDGDHSVVGMVDDVTELVAHHRRLTDFAERDALTGLANRRGATRALEEALVSGEPVAVLFADLDEFKQVNDGWGHQAGDRVLTTVGQALVRTVRPGDIVGRWGGDEFILVCPGLTPTQAADLTDRLLLATSRPLDLDAQFAYAPAISFGVVAPRPGETAEQVLRRADLAMYQAKRRRHGGGDGAGVGPAGIEPATEGS